MSGVGHRATGPELALRKRLHGAGFRFRVQFPVPARPRRSIDIAFPRWRVAVFVDGCFWHSCPEHRTEPTANREWWLKKLRSNSDRDTDTDEALRKAGWTVVRVWEHQTVDDGYSDVLAALRASGHPRARVQVPEAFVSVHRARVIRPTDVGGVLGGDR
ncbi:MAG TPA: very short patch repair endonuclease [Actinomycetaceae bacterium]|nr:very short patch repair endonuclease [Actinomycetaceae bacterium]